MKRLSTGLDRTFRAHQHGILDYTFESDRDIFRQDHRSVLVVQVEDVRRDQHTLAVATALLPVDFYLHRAVNFTGSDVRLPFDDIG